MLGTSDSDKTLLNHFFVEMISFISINFRNRREVNEFEDENAILIKSNHDDNEVFDNLIKRKILVRNEDLDSQRNLDESKDKASVNK
jgi:hypothetical protein